MAGRHASPETPQDPTRPHKTTVCALLIYVLFSQEKDKKYTVGLENLKVRDMDGNFMSRRLNFALFNIEGR